MIIQTHILILTFFLRSSNKCNYFLYLLIRCFIINGSITYKQNSITHIQIMPSSISNPFISHSKRVMLISEYTTNHHPLRLETDATHSRQQLISLSVTFRGKRCAATRASSPVLQLYPEKRLNAFISQNIPLIHICHLFWMNLANPSKCIYAISLSIQQPSSLL